MIWKPHATVAAVIEQDGHFLVVEEESDGRVVFNQPAGHLDPDESLLDAVIRETREETAWRFLPEAITGIYRWKQPHTERTFLRITFCGQVDDFHTEQALDDGIIRAVWMTREQLIEHRQQLRSPLVLRCIDDYLANIRYPLELLTDI